MKKKNANGEGCVRKRSDGRWEAVITIGEKDGKQIRKSLYGKTKAGVLKKKTELEHQLISGSYIEKSEMSVSDWMKIWQRDYLKGVKLSTVAQYDYQNRVNIAPIIGEIQLQKLTPMMIQRMYNQLQEPHQITQINGIAKDVEGLAPKSIKNLHGVLHKALSQAVMCQVIKSNPSDACILPRIQKKEMHFMDRNLVTKFLGECKGKLYEDIMYVTLFSGMREAEAVGLTWPCVDFEKSRIHVVKQLKRERQLDGSNKYVFDSLKNGKTRIVNVAPSVLEVLKKTKEKQEEYAKQPMYSNPDQLVFTDEIGQRISPVSVYGCYKKRVKAIGAPEIRFHDLRHSYATISIQNGDDVKTVSENLGHATAAFTLDVYGHVTEEMKRKSADGMESFINSLPVDKSR